jgi:DNA invertase Pin-like site-specific DNA recombinase
MSLSNKRKNELVRNFKNLPEKKTERNHYLFSKKQIISIVELRENGYTPVEIEKILNISVYIIHRLWNRGKKIIKDDFKIMNNEFNNYPINDINSSPLIDSF